MSEEISDFKRNSSMIAQALASGTGTTGVASKLRAATIEEPENETTLLKVDSGFNKQRVARVEFGPENTSKAITITPRTSPMEAFDGMMAKVSFDEFIYCE